MDVSITEMIQDDPIPGTITPTNPAGIDSDTLQEVSIYPGDEEQAYEEGANSASPRDGLVTIERSGGLGIDQPLTVYYKAVKGGEAKAATPGDDYTLSGTQSPAYGYESVTIPANQKMLTVVLHAIDDTEVEGTEVATVELLAGPTETSIPTYSLSEAAVKAIIGIVDNDVEVPVNDFKIIAAGIDLGGQGVLKDTGDQKRYDADWAGLDWSDSDGNGVIDKGEANFPVSYRRTIGADKTYLKATPTFWVKGTFDSNADWYIVGDDQGVTGADEFSPSVKATITSLGNGKYKISQAEITSSHELGDEIWTGELKVKWRLENRGNNPVTAKQYAETSTQLYITGDAAINAFHTVLDVGCRNAKGKNPDTQQNDVINLIWSDFQNSVVDGLKNANGDHMVYWGEISQKYANSCANWQTKDLVSIKDGQCGAWARFFVDILRAEGIQGVNLVAITVPKETIREKILNGQKIDDYNNWDVKAAFAVKDNAMGQGNIANVVRKFFDHAVVKIQGVQKVFDPSYGKLISIGANSNGDSEWEDSSVGKFIYFYDWKKRTGNTNPGPMNDHFEQPESKKRGDPKRVVLTIDNTY